MGETVEFASNGNTASGYLARPGGEGTCPGVLVLQEWWGLVPQLRSVCDRLAEEGFVALAPDLYHGEIAQHTEMDRARHLMEAMPHDRAARDMGGAVTHLLDHPAVRGQGVGVVGFCMGGLLTIVISAFQGERVRAAVSYYGAPLQDPPDMSGLTAPVLAHIAAEDGLFPHDAMVQFFDRLREQGKDVVQHVYEGAGHAFANDENSMGTYDPEQTAIAWERTISFLRAHLA